MKQLFCILLAAGILHTAATAQTTNTESFDGATFPPTGWTQNTNTAYLFRVTSGANPTQATHSGAGEVEFNSYSLSSGVANLVTPIIDWSCRGGSTPTLSFWFYRDVTAYNSATYAAEGVNIYVNTSAAVGGTQLGFVPRAGSQTATGMASGAATSATSQWIQYTFNIPAGFNTSTNYIIFNFVSKYGDNCFMDDVQWISYPGPTVAAIGGGAASVCVGATTPAFTDATGGGTWSVTNGTGSATINGSNQVTGVTAGTATVNYAVTSGGCTTKSTYPITITPSCSGTPTAGTALASVTSGCSSYASTLSLSGASAASCGLSYQWYSSANNSTWTSLGAGATSATYAATVSANTYYQCVLTCANGAATATSTSVYCAEGAPTNDACSGAIALTSGVAVASTNLCATTSTGGVTDPTPSACGYDGLGVNNTIWYTYTTGASAGTLTVSLTHGTMTYAALSIVSGSCGAYTQVGCSDPNTTTANPSATVCLLANTTYYIMVWDDGGTAGTFTLTPTFVSSSALAAIGGGAATVCVGSTTPAFTDATGGGTWSITNGTGSATISAGGVVTGVSKGTATVVYSVGCASATYTITINTVPTVSAIGGGAASVCVGGTTPAFTDATVGGTWSITNGTGSATISAGGVVTGVSLGTATVNYAVTNTCGTTTVTYPISVQTACSGTPNAGSAYPSVAASCSSYTSVVSLSGGNISGQCGISYQWYSSPNNSTWTSLGAGATSSSYTATVSATTYYECIATCSNGGLSGTSVSTYCQEGPASNDACATPVIAGVVTPSSPYSVYSNNLCATLNTGMADPTASCGGVGVGTLWYTFTTPSYASNYSITVVGASMTKPGIAVYSGVCGGFTQVGCSYIGTSTGIPTISLSCLPANTTYYVMVYCNGIAGDFFLNITSPSCSGGNAEASVTNKCTAGNYASTMSLINVTGCVTGYQWQTSTDNATWSNVVGATSSSYAATISSNIYYQCVVTCSDGSTSSSQSVFCTAPGTAPANDNCANAQILTFYGGINLGDYLSQAQGDNTCATADGTSQCFTANKSLWYKFQAPVAGSYFVGVLGNTMNLPELSVTTGACGAFTEYSCAGGKPYGGINYPWDSYWGGQTGGAEYTLGYSPFSNFGGDIDYDGSSNYSQAGICNVTAGQWVYIMVDNYSGSLNFNGSGNPCNSGGSCGTYVAGPGSAGTFTLYVGVLNNDAIPSGVVVNSCGSIFNSSTIGATNCGNGLGDGYYNNLDNSSTVCSGSAGASCGGGGGVAGNACNAGSGTNGGDVGYSVENDSWYQFCVVANSTVTVNFQPVLSSCIPSAGAGLQMSIFTGVPGSLTKLAGGFCQMDVTGIFVNTFAVPASTCVYVEVDGYGGTNCNYQLAITMIPNCVLSVDILSFSGVLTDDVKTKLNWVTASETNSGYYLVERSTDGINYSAIGRVKAAGNSTNQIGYEFYDNNPAKGINYYKLSEVDKNGLSNFLGYVTIKNSASLPLFNVYPNPAQNSITLSLKNFATPVISYELYDAQGALMQTESINLIDGNQDYKIDLSNLNKGFYFIKVNAGDELLKRTFIKAE